MTDFIGKHMNEACFIKLYKFNIRSLRRQFSKDNYIYILTFFDSIHFLNQIFQIVILRICHTVYSSFLKNKQNKQKCLDILKSNLRIVVLTPFFHEYSFSFLFCNTRYTPVCLFIPFCFSKPVYIFVCDSFLYLIISCYRCMQSLQFDFC